MVETRINFDGANLNVSVDYSSVLSVPAVSGSKRSNCLSHPVCFT